MVNDTYSDIISNAGSIHKYTIYLHSHGRNPRGDRGDDPPKILGGGDDIAHIPPINYPHSYEKLPFAWIIGE